MGAGAFFGSGAARPGRPLPLPRLAPARPAGGRPAALPGRASRASGSGCARRGPSGTFDAHRRPDGLRGVRHRRGGALRRGERGGPRRRAPAPGASCWRRRPSCRSSLRSITRGRGPTSAVPDSAGRRRARAVGRDPDPRAPGGAGRRRELPQPLPAGRPRLLGAPPDFLRRGGFRFKASLAEPDAERADPWRLLERGGGAKAAAGKDGPGTSCRRSPTRPPPPGPSTSPLAMTLEVMPDGREGLPAPAWWPFSTGSILQGPLVLAESDLLSPLPGRGGPRLLPH